LTIQQRIDAFGLLGARLRDPGNTAVSAIIDLAGRHNSWFTPSNVKRSIHSLANLLQTDNLEKWLSPYPFTHAIPKTVGLVFAGNIPLVGFHDLLAVLCAGFSAQIKLSSNDQVLYRYLIDELIEIEPGFRQQIKEVERLQDFDLVIATGSDNSARYFEYYFGKYPHIIRKNRNGVAILRGNETPEQLNALGDDIFSYFGLGCRNVSKLYLPKDYDLAKFFEGIAAHATVFDHHKYANNYDFNKSLYLINGDPHFDNGFLLLRPTPGLASPLAVVNYEEYESTEVLRENLEAVKDGIQCVVGKVNLDLPGISVVDFGRSQFPALTDYADGINTLAFLTEHYSWPNIID